MSLPPNIALTAPELIIGLSALLLLVTAVFRGDRSLAAVSWSSVVVLLGAGPAMLGQPERAFAYGGLFAADRFAQFLKVTIYASAAVSIILAVPALRRTAQGRFEYPILILLSVLGMSLMASAADLLTLYIGLELQSLALYVLAAFQRSDTRSSEAGLKYFLLGALSSGIMLFGISLVYGFAGTTQFAAVHTALGGHALALGALVGLVFTMVGLAFKVSAVPFHMWTPDVYEGAPTPVVAFFAAVPKVAAMGLFTRLLLEAFGGAQDRWQAIVAFMSVGSMFLGAVGAIGQTSFKRLMAYSSINNVGFALIGLAVGGAAGAASVLFYMAIYVVMTIGAFLAILDLRDPDGRQIEDIASLAGLNARHPGLAAALAFIMFSLAGIPPLLGFFPKLAVFRAAMDAGLYPLAILGVVASVVGAYYYLRIVKTMYFDEPRTAFGPRLSTVNGALLLASTAALSPLGWLALSPLFAAAQVAAGTLFPR